MEKEYRFIDQAAVADKLERLAAKIRSGEVEATESCLTVQTIESQKPSGLPRIGLSGSGSLSVNYSQRSEAVVPLP